MRIGPLNPIEVRLIEQADELRRALWAQSEEAQAQVQETQALLQRMQQKTEALRRRAGEATRDAVHAIAKEHGHEVPGDAVVLPGSDNRPKWLELREHEPDASEEPAASSEAKPENGASVPTPTPAQLDDALAQEDSEAAAALPASTASSTPS